MKKLISTPKKDGFYMPGEYEEHEGTYMIWPERTDNWRNGGKNVQKVFVQIASAIGLHEKITMLVSDHQYCNAVKMLPDYVRVVEMENNDSWARDCGPTFVKNSKGIIRGIDWDFNAWGGLIDGLYFPWDKDNLIASKICSMECKDYYKKDNFVLEGGSFHVDGDGTVIVTEECLLSKGRNPHMTKEEIESTLKEYLNVEKVIWLKHGMKEDETNGHVDNICAFVKPGVVTLSWTDDKENAQYQVLKECYDILSNEVDAKGRTLEIHKIQIPSPMFISKEECEGIDEINGTKRRGEGDYMAASYVNYYVSNGAVIIPGFKDPMDEEAKKTIQMLFPEREVIQIYTREVLLGGGNIHCITQQLPK